MMQRSSATESRAVGADRDPVGLAFATALSRKDFAEVLTLLHPQIDFRALTPRRSWEASDPETVVRDILSQWFDPSDDLERLVTTETGTVADRRRISYRFEGHNGDGPFVIEQQAYYTELDGQINWMRVLCSGFRPLER